MSDGSLSQDEIDALLQGSGGMDLGSGTQAPGGIELSDQETKAFQNLLNSITGAQASNLSGFMGSKPVVLKPPKVAVFTKDDYLLTVPDEVVQVNLDFTEGLSGKHSYILSPEAAAGMAGLIVGQDQVELNEMALEALKEALSTITGVALTKIGDKIGSTIMPSAGDSKQVTKETLELSEDGFVTATYPLAIEGLKPFELTEVYDINLAKNIVGLLSSAGGAQPQSMGTRDMGFSPQGGAMPGIQQPIQPGFMGAQTQPAQQSMQPPQFGAPMGMPMYQQPPNVQPVQFPSLKPQSPSQDMGNISLLMDVYMEMTVELGRTKKPIREILGMGEGTIIELDKLAGEPVDILVNHKLIATGEVVVIDENFGVRVTEIISPTERMHELT
ncbi:MAG: flagellar motor switch phosphatase FliY [Spirochaetota bacterium]